MAATLALWPAGFRQEPRRRAMSPIRPGRRRPVLSGGIELSKKPTVQQNPGRAVPLLCPLAVPRLKPLGASWTNAIRGPNMPRRPPSRLSARKRRRGRARLCREPEARNPLTEPVAQPVEQLTFNQ